ncbi:MAG TPA: hypothetical protein VLN56_02445 [Gammaproteobacteria bacterium]|nr:hypothetical protein [Gammaproteobacteria bacterium]
MRNIYFGEFREIVIGHIRSIESGQPEFQSTEWFLLRYLTRIKKNANPPSTPGRVENSMRALIRFYVDQVDEHSELGEICRQINAEYRRALRREQSE